MSWDRPRQRARLALNMCPQCGEDSSYRGGKRCFECRKKENERHRQRYAEARATGAARCTSEEYRELAMGAAEKRRARIEAGLCIQCRTPVGKFIRCTKCRSANAKAKDRWRKRQIEKAAA